MTEGGYYVSNRFGYIFCTDLRICCEKPLRREDLKRKNIGTVNDVASVLRNERFGPYPLRISCNERVSPFQPACDVSFDKLERDKPEFVNGCVEYIMKQRVKVLDLQREQMDLNFVDDGAANADRVPAGILAER